MKNLKYMELNEILDKLKKIRVYVLPDVSTLKKTKSKSDEDFEIKDEPTSHFRLSTYFEGEFVLIYGDLNILGDKNFYRAGMRLDISRKVGGGLRIEYIGVISPLVWKTGAKHTARSRYSSMRSTTTKLCFGQSVLIMAAPGKGKTSTARSIIDSFAQSGTINYRVLFGERRDDSLGVGSIDCDSSAPIKYQMYVLYKTITAALVDAYDGNNVVLGIDSLTRIVESLTASYPDSHMVSGGLSSDVILMVSNIFKMAGQYAQGTLTIVGTCLWSKSNNSWKNITVILQSSANAEFHPDIDGGASDSTRRKEVKNYPTIKLFGREFAY